MVGNPDERCIGFSFIVFCDFLCPVGSTPDIVDPVDVEAVQVHQLQLHFNHVGHGGGLSIGALRGELIRDQVAVPGQALEEPGEDFFRSAHAIGVGSIPEVQAVGHAGLKDRAQGVGMETAAEGPIISPGLGAEDNFRQMHHSDIPPYIF